MTAARSLWNPAAAGAWGGDDRLIGGSAGRFSKSRFWVIFAAFEVFWKNNARSLFSIFLEKAVRIIAVFGFFGKGNARSFFGKSNATSFLYVVFVRKDIARSVGITETIQKSAGKFLSRKLFLSVRRSAPWRKQSEWLVENYENQSIRNSQISLFAQILCKNDEKNRILGIVAQCLCKNNIFAQILCKIHPSGVSVFCNSSLFFWFIFWR